MFWINPEGWLVGVWDGDCWDLSQQCQTSSQHNPNRRCSIKLPEEFFFLYLTPHAQLFSEIPPWTRQPTDIRILTTSKNTQYSWNWRLIGTFLLQWDGALFPSDFGQAGGVVLALYSVNGLLEPLSMGGFGVVKLPHQSGRPSSSVGNFSFFSLARSLQRLQSSH